MGPMFSGTHSEVISGGNMFGTAGLIQCNPGQRLESHGHNFLGLQRRAAGGLHTTEDNNDWTLLRCADKSTSGIEGEAEENVDARSAVAAR